MRIATLTVKQQVIAYATGDGHWGMCAGVLVRFEEMTLIVSNYNGNKWSDFAEFQVKHDCDAKENGLCYTDSGIEGRANEFIQTHDAFSKIIAGDVSGSEQGMQDQFVLSCDAELTDGITDELLTALGFEITEY